jgi:hypothetical protein
MILSEKGKYAHACLCVAGIVLLIVVLIYVYICEHKVGILDSEVWKKAFEDHGLGKEIEHITHDDEMWYHNEVSTCVAYRGSVNDSKACNRSDKFCSGGKTYGNYDQQVLAIKEALMNGGEHPLCPLIYPGAD